MLLALKKPFITDDTIILTQYHESGDEGTTEAKSRVHLNKSEEGSLEEVMPDHQDLQSRSHDIFFTTQPCARFLQGDQDVFIT